MMSEKLEYEQVYWHISYILWCDVRRCVNNNVNKEIYIIMMMSDRSGCANRLQHDLYTLEITKIKLITMRTKLS